MTALPVVLCRTCHGYRNWQPSDHPSTRCYCPRVGRMQPDEVDAVQLLRSRGYAVSLGRGPEGEET